MKTLLTAALFATVLIAAGCSPTKTDITTLPTPSPTIAQDQTPNTIPDVRTSPRVTDSAPTPTPTGVRYGMYSTAAVQAAQANQSKVVLFFHADWCPFCIEADKQFNARLSEIPQNVTVLKTNYDTETALKKKYGITYQHTFVQIDTQGNLVSKWNGGDVENLKKYLK